MGGKLVALTIVTALAILSVVPMKTHAVGVELTDKNWSASFSLLSPREMLASMHFTPTTIGLIAMILAIAGYIAVKIIRAR